MGCAGHEARGIVGKEGFEGASHDVGKLVFLYPVPYVEQKNAF